MKLLFAIAGLTLLGGCSFYPDEPKIVVQALDVTNTATTVKAPIVIKEKNHENAI
jgi:hypothetical protein